MLDRLETIATGLDHPEGIAWGPDGRLYAGGEAGQVFAIDVDDGSVSEIASTGGFMYGITLDGRGGVYACDFGAGEIVRVDPGGDVASVTRGTPAHPIRVPNFMAFDDHGSLFATDSGGWGDDDGVLFRVAGGETTVWSERVPGFPNGCCMTADGGALLVVESARRRVVRVPIREDGTAGEPEPIVDLAGSQPDGIALAADGTMFVGCYRPDRVWRISPGGEPEIWLDDPDGVALNQPANVAFYGRELDRLAISSLGGWSIVGIDPGVPGLALRAPQPDTA
jgi:gluconolactonase